MRSIALLRSVSVAHVVAVMPAPAVAARVARATDRIVRDWASDSPACAAASAGGDEAAARLVAAIDTAGATLPGTPSCSAAVLGTLAPLCRRVVRSEIALLPDSASGHDARRRSLERVRASLDTTFPADACGGGATVADAETTLLRLAAGALGDATTRGLRALAADAGREVGVAVEPDEVFADPLYDAALAHDTTSRTAENAMKWGPIHPQPDSWVFGPADAVVALAAARGQRVCGHNLVWGALQLPAYVENASDAEALRAMMVEHISTVAGRYAGHVAQWDVVNEPLAGVLDPPTADGLDDNVFRRLLGPGYVAEALHLARAADPAAHLFVNEVGIEAPGPRQDRFYALVQELLAGGAPLDGLGFQVHLGLAPIGQYPDEATIAASLRRFTDLGLTVELTELDVTLVFRTGDLPSRLAFQGGYYRSAVAACATVPACSGVTTWGLSDRHSWLRSFFGSTDWPLPFDDDWRRKPAYFGMRAALLEAALRCGA
ncbi:MAG: endo-1,4-beta-xylanase [Deltaproteobacteria bacterium]|nr:endo-1,4-beta-xylanase [Deltaproteobacteria bacterium]